MYDESPNTRPVHVYTPLRNFLEQFFRFVLSTLVVPSPPRILRCILSNWMNYLKAHCCVRSVLMNAQSRLGFNLARFSHDDFEALLLLLYTSRSGSPLIAFIHTGLLHVKGEDAVYAEHERYVPRKPTALVPSNIMCPSIWRFVLVDC